MTSAGGAIISAPGKLFLAGEYAVLEGGAAVVAAVSRRATGRFVVGATAASPLVAEAERQARQWAADSHGATLPPGSVEVDTGAFHDHGRKLGLGSSAAAAVVTVAAIADAAALDVDAQRGAVARVAARAHRAFQGGVGSGGDVAAIARGGLVGVSPDAGGGDGDLTVESLAPLPARMVVFATRHASSTADFVRAVLAFKARERRPHGVLIGALAEAASLFRKAVRNADTGDLIDAARDAHEAMQALGRAAGVPIVTPELAAAARLAVERGGAAKPSGAGGGDVGVGLFPDQAAEESFRARIPELGLSVLDIRIDSNGLMRRDGGAASQESEEREHVARQA